MIIKEESFTSLNVSYVSKATIERLGILIKVVLERKRTGEASTSAGTTIKGIIILSLPWYGIRIKDVVYEYQQIPPFSFQ